MRVIIKRSFQSITRSIRHYSTFEVGDFCMLRKVRSDKKMFIGPLEHEGKRDVQRGIITHDAIIGKKPRTVIKTHNDAAAYMVHFPTLEDYVLNVPRECTPIYPKDASAIVQMLDLEPGHRVLEAGTGNGSLTLYLAKAIAGGEGGQVDTFDIRESHSNLARKNVNRYSRGKYSSMVRFHLGSVGEELRSKNKEEEIYDGMVLDMPEPHEEIPRILPFLKNDRFLVCYLPNMTQVLKLAETILDLPFMMESCIEAEWKEWEVRATQIRNKIKQDQEEKEDEKPVAPMNAAWICRPKNFDVKGHTAFLVKLRKSVTVIT
ncbi:S-adenosyl-L-methionine-dependent methyltransferase [Cokeromyces recurvatus]|uniref:S-adenosyl-L-methionine-dependent methyltransferase n=1 Tax=Cokeromyces recurvatus TaxID=90255 RepID=UPI002221292F|nr:S-adenosyl-L-methionine-dependent methyltransferase [Cokeromyces recurvatus]KAI7901789.1 S-adenosyl-L-methionine-dependent methyltransferase [Cokeromyces recurvatus]